MSIESALEKVIHKCKLIAELKTLVADDEIELAMELLRIIEDELEK